MQSEIQELRAEIQAQLLEIPGLKFLGFIDRDPSVNYDFMFYTHTIEWSDQVSLASSEDDLIKWIEETLRIKEIQGEYFIGYERRSPHIFIGYVRVHLSPDYEWVRPLWNLAKGRELYFLSPSFDKFLQILLQEEGFVAEFRTQKTDKEQ